MSDLETRLRALGEDVHYPATPDLLGGVAGRLAVRPRRRGLRLAVALAVLAAAVGAVLAASPGARSAFLELFHLSGATVTRVETLPPVTETQPRADARPVWAPGTAVPLAEARRRVGFRIRIPHTAATRQERSVLLDEQGGGVVTLVWCCRPAIALTQFVGEAVPYLQKFASPATRIEPVRVGGQQGYWIAGGLHLVLFRGLDGDFHQSELRVAGNVLLWVDDDVTLRLAGRLTKQQALELAATIR